MDEEQRRVVYRYLIARVGLLRGAELPPLADLDHQMKNGFQVIAGGVVIDRTTNQPIVGDQQDPAFFAAIVKGDEDATSISPQDLEQTRRFVLHDEGSLPPPFGRADEPRGIVGRERADPLVETRKAAEEARWGTSHEATPVVV